MQVLNATDWVTITKAEYRIPKQRIIVNAVSTDPTATLYMMPPAAQGKSMVPNPVQLVRIPGIIGLVADVLGPEPTNILLVFSTLGGNNRTGVTKLRL